MGTKDPRINAYIAKAAPFAQPVLKHLRKIVHAGCPDVQETIKWSMPHFDYKGIMCGMAAHKQHCSFGFWQRAALALDGNGEEADGMGQFGRITSVSDLPDEQTLLAYVRKAAALKDAAALQPKMPKPPAKPKAPAAELTVPDYLANALKMNARARATWEKSSPSHRREYITWLMEAKRDETRERRLETTLEWLAEGKSRNWKYERK
jgi:uncharacterized protein YdeI (YjbR/CyaY-like superfamily)